MKKNETESPAVPKHGHQMHGLGLGDFKGEGADIAYGQAGKSGCKSDAKKIQSQMKHYGWEGSSEY